MCIRDSITSVQLSDLAAEPADDVEHEAMHERLLPGTGIVDYAALWDALDHIGATPVVAAEVLRDDLVPSGMTAMGAAVHDAARGVLP